MPSFIPAIRCVAALGVALIAAVEPALAGIDPPAVPAPILGAGVPALIAFAGGYWAIRKRRR
ncbi:hypothetical protein [Sphingomonas sp.]|jgi:hypothetical protein|uniref:hypothetical protein n=1 Tax=Sphingomonas sp. TaxID=28214 RepID=UPI002FCA5400